MKVAVATAGKEEERNGIGLPLNLGRMGLAVLGLRPDRLGYLRNMRKLALLGILYVV